MMFFVILFTVNLFFANDMLFHEVGEGEGTPTITSLPVWSQYAILLIFGFAIMPLLYFRFRGEE